AGEGAFAGLELVVRHPLREIAEAGIDPHLPVLVEPGGKQIDAPFESPVDAHPHRATVPEVAVRVFERRAMARADHETTRLVADRVVRRIGEGAERALADVDTGRVDVVFGTRRAVLQVVAAVVLVHPRALDVGRDTRVAMVLAEAFPAMHRRIGAQQRHRLADEFHALAFTLGLLIEREIELRAVDRKHVGRVPVQIGFAVVVLEQAGVPRTRRQVTRLHLQFVPGPYRARDRWQQTRPEIPAAVYRIG